MRRTLLVPLAALLALGAAVPSVGRAERATVPGPVKRLPPGVLAVVRIPALGKEWRQPVYEGTGAEQLARGLAHYTGTALPGAQGNFALAGHRSSVSGFEPFAELPDAVGPGVRVDVTTERATYTYRVTATRRTTPGDDAVLDPDQGRGADPARRLITLTTCTPRYGSTGRFIVFGELVAAPDE